MNKKAEFKLTSMLIGVLLVAFFATFFTVFLNETNTAYGGNLSNQTRQDLKAFDQQATILAGVEDTSNQALNASQGKSFTDLLGGFFKSGYSALIISKDSVSTVQSVSKEGVKHLGLAPEISNLLKVLIPGIIFILVIIGIIVSVLVRTKL